MPGGESTRSRRGAARLVTSIAALAALTLPSLGCSPVTSGDTDSAAGSSNAPVEEAARPDIVVLLVAGLRADPPGAGGAADAFFGAIPRTPSVRFRNAYAPTVTPFISLGALLAGSYPSAIPLCGHYVETGAAAKQAAWCADIPPDRHTLPEILGLYGYRTALVTAGQPRFEPLADEFQTWIDVPDPGTGRTARWGALQREARRWWEAEGTQPRLLVVFGEDLVETAIPGMKRDLGLPTDLLDQLWQPLAADGGPPSIPEASHDLLLQTYSEAARGMGTGCGGMLEALGGGADGTSPWFVVASTNGLNLLEQGGYAEGGVYPLDSGLVLDRTARVPLAVYGPEAGASARDDEDVVELLDLFPTLIQLAAAKPPAGMREGDLIDPSTPRRGEAYVEFGDMLALRKGRHLLAFRALIHDGNALDPELDRRLHDDGLARDTGAYGLFDVAGDSMQEQNLLESRSSDARELRQRMIQVRADAGAVPESALTPERLWEIRMSPSQGYW